MGRAEARPSESVHAGNNEDVAQDVETMRKRLIFVFLTTICSTATALDPAAVRAAAAYSTAQGGTSILVLQHGQTLFEQSAREAHKIFSGTKAFWGLAALAAAEDGLLSLDEPVAETIPEWRNDPRKARVTIRQLLDFSSGLEPVFRLHANNPGDRDRIAIRAPIIGSPGSSFIYGPSALQVFHQVLKQKLRGETPTGYLERRVLRRLGLGSQRYLKDRAGNPLLASGWEMSARQWARLGEVVLANGAPAVKSGSLAQAWRGSPANRAFGFGWWNNQAAPGGHEFDFEDALRANWPRQSWGGAALCRDAPSDLVASIGSGRQRLYVIPSMDLVVVRFGSGARFSDGRFLRLLLAK